MKKTKKEKLLVIYKLKIIYFIKYLIIDIIKRIRNGPEFNEYGLTIFCGRQGGGKTVAMTEYLERIRRKFPNVIIVTNYNYKYQNREFNSWRDLLEIRNGIDGVIFAIDELQDEYNSNDWKDFPEFILSEITQQRKQRIKVVATSQVYTRVVKQLREQTFEVIECRTLFNRWTFTRTFDAEDYNSVIDNPELKRKLRRKSRLSFIQTDEFRNLFDSYKKVEKMKKTKYIPRYERVN